MKPVIIIPARMSSSRLPGKPLADIQGTPMIVRVLQRAQAADIGPVVVACAEEEIAGVVKAAGGLPILTDPALPSGSDRVHQALQQFDPAGEYDVVVNLQGDLPCIDPQDIGRALLPLSSPEVGIATLVTAVTSEEEAQSLSVVKAVCVFEPGEPVGRALYFSRDAIPWGEERLLHHVGIYAYRRPALDMFVTLPESLLERSEKLEQLRALEAGIRIGCALIEKAPLGVDTPADLDRVRQNVSQEQP